MSASTCSWLRLQRAWRSASFVSATLHIQGRERGRGERTRSIRGLPEKLLHLEDPVVINGSIHSKVLVGQGRVGMVKIMIVVRAISTIISHPVSIRHVSNALHTERISIGPSEYSIASGASATDRPLATTTPHNLFISNLSFSYHRIQLLILELNQLYEEISWCWAH